MQRQLLRIALLALAVLLTAAPARAQNAAPGPALNDYRAKLAQYLQARQAYDEQADAYWNAVVEKRRLRNAKRRDRVAIQLADYVLTQPPLYTGPPRPVDPAAPGPEPSERPPIPLIADFLQAAAEQYGFVPQRPQSENDFKRAYAKAALAAGLTRDQIVGVYAFETGGNGTYDMQAGVSATRRARDLAGHRLQPVAQHQFGLDPGRERRRPAGGAAAKGQDARPATPRSRSSARSRRSSA